MCKIFHSFSLVLYLWLAPGYHRNDVMEPFSAPTTTQTANNQDRRNQAIRAEYARAKDSGKRSAFVITALANQFYLKESTVEAIVWGRGRYQVQSSTSQTAQA